MMQWTIDSILRNTNLPGSINISFQMLCFLKNKVASDLNQSNFFSKALRKVHILLILYIWSLKSLLIANLSKLKDWDSTMQDYLHVLL